jgi:ABC-type sugar transport system permease subunit
MVKASSRAHPWAMLVPSLGLLFAFVLIPLVLAAWQSLYAWDLLTPPVPVGLGNYRALGETGAIGGALGRTLLFSAFVVAGATTLGFYLAFLLGRPGAFFAWVRASIFGAYVVSWVAVALLWLWLLDGDIGLIAVAARGLGLPRLGFLTDPGLVLVTLAAVTVWKIAGYAMIVFQAGLRAIPVPVLEAAALDGAGTFARLRHVTLPLLAPTTAFVATTSLVVSFQAFDVVRIMTQGGPAHASELFVYAIYEQFFMNLSVGRVSALAVVFFFVLLVLAVVQLRAFAGRAEARRREVPALRVLRSGPGGGLEREGAR